MTKVDGRDDLFEEPQRLAGRESPFAHQVVKELATRNVFEHQIKIFAIFVDIDQLENVLMFKQFHDGDLALN